jgi:hypothetical protein
MECGSAGEQGNAHQSTTRQKNQRRRIENDHGKEHGVCLTIVNG